MALKPKTENWTMVVVGAWNTRIFTPEWVGNRLFNSPEITAQLTFTPGRSVVRFTQGDLILIPQEERVIAGVHQASPTALQEAEEVIVRLLTTLPHTPVTALGVNFGFRDASPGPGLTENFRAPDLVRLGESYEVGRIEISRSLRFDQGVVNLKHVWDEDCVEIHFNYHFPTGTANEALARLRGRSGEYWSAAKAMLDEIYGLQVQEDADD